MALLSRGPSVGAIALLIVLIVVLVSGGGGEGGGDGDTAGGEGPRRGIVVPVADIVDGDTIEVLIDGTEEDVRYIGVDTYV